MSIKINRRGVYWHWSDRCYALTWICRFAWLPSKDTGLGERSWCVHWGWFMAEKVDYEASDHGKALAKRVMAALRQLAADAADVADSTSKKVK